MTPPAFIVAGPRAGSALLARALGLDAANPFAIPSGARLIYLYREPRASIASGLAPVAAPKKALIDAAVAEWETCTRQILEHLATRDDDTWTATTYDALMTTPRSELARLAGFADVTLLDAAVAPTDPEAWRVHELAVMPRMSALAGTNTRAKLVCATAMAAPGH